MAQTLASRLASSESPWARGLRILIHNRMAMAGAAVLLIWAVTAMAAPLIAPYDALSQSVEDRLSPPSAQHPFGTDELGRDVFSRVVYGARISLPVGLVVILFSMLMGASVGALAGYIGGVFDLLVMRLADITLAAKGKVATVTCLTAQAVARGDTLVTSSANLAVSRVPAHGEAIPPTSAGL